jgi:hypothetical protein
VLLALIAVQASLLAGRAPAVAAETPSRSPAEATLSYTGDFPDPFVLVKHGRYHAYATQVGSPGHWTNVPEMTSTDLVSWTPIVDALPALPDWAMAGNTWAPAVLQRGGGYVLYYTARHRAAGRQCISAAVAPTPAGPFKDVSAGPLVCQLSLGGSIDPYPFVDRDGTAYLLWKSDGNAIGQPTSLWSRQLSPDGLGWPSSSTPVRLLDERPGTWQAPAIEGPAMVRTGATYDLFYGAGRWNSRSSGIGYATCDSPLGPCTDRTASGPWLRTGHDGGPVGPQGPTIFTDSHGDVRLGFAGWVGPVGYRNGGARAVWTGRLAFPGGVPTFSR